MLLLFCGGGPSLHLVCGRRRPPSAAPLSNNSLVARAWVGQVMRVLVPAFNGTRLHLTQSCRGDPAVLDAIGGAIVSSAQTIPGGAGL